MKLLVYSEGPTLLSDRYCGAISYNKISDKVNLNNIFFENIT
jgi:hypothetical protein